MNANIFKGYNNLSYTKGKFLSDKSYAYDTVYFVSKFIERFQKGGIFYLNDHRIDFDNYIVDMFNRNGDARGISNYYLEVINILEYADVIEKLENKSYRILKPDTLKFINVRMENAYIFNYLLVYNTFKNDGILGIYKLFCREKDLSKKKDYVYKIHDIICKKSNSIGSTDSVWAFLNTKYALTVLNFINRQNYVSREFNIKEIADISSISLNVKGTKTYNSLPKNNDYLDFFDVHYVGNFLEKYLFSKAYLDADNSGEANENTASEVADLKLDLIELNSECEERNLSINEKNILIENYMKLRNTGAQKRFRITLLTKVPHKCAICDFGFMDLVAAVHIKPYAKCDRIYDALNVENGILLCPLHDLLFESNKLIIDIDGKIKVNNNLKGKEKELLLDKKETIDSSYLTNGRKNYLSWRNTDKQ